MEAPNFPPENIFRAATPMADTGLLQARLGAQERVSGAKSLVSGVSSPTGEDKDDDGIRKSTLFLQHITRSCRGSASACKYHHRLGETGSVETQKSVSQWAAISRTSSRGQ